MSAEDTQEKSRSFLSMIWSLIKSLLKILVIPVIAFAAGFVVCIMFRNNIKLLKYDTLLFNIWGIEVSAVDQDLEGKISTLEAEKSALEAFREIALVSIDKLEKDNHELNQYKEFVIDLRGGSSR